MEATARKTILRIECWHAVLVVEHCFWSWGGAHAIDGMALIAGGVFMGVNFFLLEFWCRRDSDAAGEQGSS